ncbi:hypothetical protein SMAX5B_016679 [Scophthalmus maximus]|uniref:DNA-directed RNA polymerase III subunit RPC4-like n=1 Tax=Scophthalmus maximus TaxID=52904 RepID=A0A2U9CKS3_SCOMX|nr:hypothetical protein SMAX5B_016679 [Scophthalmus maximus]
MLVANASSVQQHTSSFSPKRDTKPRQKRHYFKDITCCHTSALEDAAGTKEKSSLHHRRHQQHSRMPHYQQGEHTGPTSSILNESLCAGFPPLLLFLDRLKAGWQVATHLRDSTTSPVCKLVKKERKHSEEDEDEILSKLQRDDFIDDPDLRNDAKLKPTQLPLSSTTCHSVVTVFVVLPGPEKPPSRPLVCAAQDRVGRTEVPKPEEPSLVNLLQDLSLSGEEELFFMQLPDCMPGRASEQKVMAPTVRSTSEKLAKNDSRPEDKRPAHLQAQQAVMKEGCPVLSQLPEGFLGKLQIRKSGKVELKLGDIVMDISEGAAFSFLQQLVSVRLSDGKTGDMMVLGNVHHKLVLSPDFHTLLRQASTEQQKETR